MSHLNDDPSVNLSLLTKKNLLSFAEALSEAGSEHKFQKRLIYLFALQRISIGFLFTVFPFLFKQPEFQCLTPDKESYVPCDYTPENCELGMIPLPSFSHTLVAQFGLYCDREIEATMAKTYFAIAGTIGTLFITPLADLIGRRPGLVMSYVTGATSLFLLPLVWNFKLFCILLTISGLCFSPFTTSSMLLLNEVSGVKTRAYGSVVINIFWTLGQIVVGVLAYLFNNNWRLLIFFGLSVPLASLAKPLIKYARESPMYLVAKKKYGKAKDGLRVIAQVNDKNLPEFDFKEEGLSPKLPGQSQRKRKYNVLDLFRIPSLRKATFFASILSFTIYLNYYGVIFALTSIKVNSYVLTICLATTEIFAYSLLGIFIRRASRRKAFATLMLISSASNLLFLFFPVPEHCSHDEQTCFQVYVQLGLSMMNRFSTALVMSLSSMYVSEIFPTPVRAIGSGLTIFVGRLGSSFATLAVALCLSFNLNPIILFGLACLPAAFMSKKAKETKGLPLPEVVDEDREMERHERLEGKYQSHEVSTGTSIHIGSPEIELEEQSESIEVDNKNNFEPRNEIQV